MNPFIIPEPKHSEVFEGSRHFPLSIISKDSSWEDEIDIFATAFQKLYGRSLDKQPGGIEWIRSAECRADAYRIDTTGNTIRIVAGDREGLLYAFASLLQMILVKGDRICTPSVRLEDHPDKDYRALMVDLARQFHPAKTIFQYIDLCFFYKIKYLHLHLIDDQLYTLPSKAFPKMPTPGKSYTEEEIRAFNRYADQRGVFLIPELEAPGHAASLTSAYPEIFANQIADDAHTRLITENGDAISHENLICAGSPTAMQGLRTVLDEICELFPNSPYIHIGGDEANFDAWQHCAVCKTYMQQNNIADVGELYSDFIAHIAQAVLDRGRTPIVWEGFPIKGAERIPRETIVIAWESYYHKSYELLNEGFRIINASWQPLYIVSSLVRRWYAKDILRWNVYNWQHWWTESEAALNPIHVTPTDAVLGAQICAWGCTFEKEIGLVMENLAALSERTWNLKRKTEESELLERFEPLLKLASRLIAER